MKTTVITESGNIYDVVEKFSGSLSIQGEVFIPQLNKSLHTDWYVKGDEVTCSLCSSQARGSFKVYTMSPGMEKAVEKERNNRKEAKKQEEVYRRSQMFTY